MLAMTVADGAVGERNGPFERIENGAGADLRGGAGKLIAAAQPARGGHEARALQLLEQLAHSRQGDMRLLRERRRGLHALGRLRPARPGSTVA